jgi:hypothetical protein
MLARRKARASCRVSKSLLDAGRGPERRSAAGIAYDLRQVAPLSEIGRKVVTLECFIDCTTPPQAIRTVLTTCIASV